ncbi:sacsin N-terminal ATP-binding-like domain-containing protein [Brevundimonas sp. KM4]|uniref:sacsin N-terminal ATP-binding-like domain-containing protein n=1 Tax=Brevundimonas sp. KM4 TaxID=1628191 RepID=UPI0005F7B5E2|nr:ATPase [Brevundimonas sp. KM4]KJV40261.1 ATPase [Brevundimonas sp. KM4]
MSVSHQIETVAADPPDYFRSIQERATKRWDQLEADPELAGPWHQLFKQVQSPRHILSELLQNADDAGASEARVSIEDDRFVFEHNGEDFIEAHFASICRFGYSNKRALHTIGFRGIGFKSTFSLGDRVELFTPTLAVAFERVRFTQPHWIGSRHPTTGTTRVEVAIANPLLRREVEKNLDEWLKSPVSLLFFKKIRRLQIGDSEVHWQSLGPGPIAESEWMALDQKAEDPLLLVRSGEESFPSEALDEIRQERMLGAEDGGDFPPCRVEIVLGAKGRLYVVLPTGVETALPFACNAPFIQDPARLKIKDPETSPTNRWLLNRAGELAARAMMEWLEQTKTGPQDRADAYGLLPDVDREAATLEGACGAIVELAFDGAVEGKSILLTEEGSLVEAKAAITVPRSIFEIWPADQAMALLDTKSRPALCQHVSAKNRTKLVHWGLIEEFSKSDLLERLRSKHLPKPATWRHLLNLWTYIAPEVTGWQCHDADALRIVPVQGKEVLYAASEIVRLGEKKLLQSEEDWEFLASHLIVLNQNWTRYLADQRRDKAEGGSRNDPVEAAFAVLEEIGLDGTSDVNAVIERVAADYFGSGQAKLVECVQLAQIAAKLGVTIGDSFRYACADRTLRAISNSVLFDENGALEELLPEAIRKAQLLHGDYVASFKSCTREDWLRWVSSGRSGLQTMAPLVQKRQSLYGRQQLTAEAQARGARSALYYPYVTNQFVIEDWDFPADYWRHWEVLAKTDAGIWTKIVGKILDQRDTYWSRAVSARLLQVATTGSTRSISSERLLTDWLLKLRAKRCLPDTRNMVQLPADLVRRTPETEALIDVEPFVHGLLDRETTRPLLDLLGVRSTPSGPGRLLDRLRALAKSDKAPAHEVEKWYRRLDQMLDGCSTADAQNIRTAFKTEKLILAQDGTWVTSGGVFLAGDEEDVPGAAVVRASVLDLSLWHRVGVADRPSADLALQWLGTLASGKVLSADDARRVRTLLVRYPTRIWEECGHWLNLVGEWAPVEMLAFGLSMQTLFRWSHLHEWVKRKTADFQRLSGEVVQAPPFSALPALSDLVEEHFNQPSLLAGMEDRRAWLTAFGNQLGRIELADAGETERVRALAEAIAATSWVQTPKLEVVPYLDGVPAGTARLTDILWLERKLFVSPLSKAKLAKRVPEEIGRSLSSDIRAALAYAFERSPEDIREYLEENFTLSPEHIVVAPTVATQPVAEPGDDDGVDQVAEDAQSDAELTDVADLLTAEDEATPQPVPTLPTGEPDRELIETELATRPRAAPKPPRPSVMARFAAAQGYKADGEDRFFHADGSWIGRANGTRFPWERRSAGGEILRHYYPKDHCLEHEPLQLEADVWGLLDQKPELYSFILINPEGGPVEMTGARLRTLRDGGELTIHPATYRLVYDFDD